MGQLVFQATLGGQVNLVGPNTASSFNINVPAVAGTMVTTGDTGTVTNTMLAGSIANNKLTNSSVTIGSTSVSLGATASSLSGLTGVSSTSITDSGLTSGRVTYATTGGLLTDSANLTFDGSNLGLGVTPSAWGSGRKILQMTNGAAFGDYSGFTGLSQNYYNNGTSDLYIANGFASRYLQGSGQHLWYNAPSGTAGSAITFTQAMTLDASGNLGVGTTSPASGYRLHIAGDVRIANSGSETGALQISQESSQALIQTRYSQPLLFGTNATERARIDTSGNLLVGSNSQPVAGIAARLAVSQSVADYSAIIVNSQSTAANCYGARIQYTGAAPNGTGNVFLTMTDTGGDRAYFRSNGGLSNYSANNTNLSDARTKTDIQDAGSYLSKICSIPVRTFKYKDQTDDLLNLGVIAQEVEAVAPELVDVTGFGETPEDGIPLKSIYQTDLQYALMKCIQEQQAIITSLTERITALEAK